MKNDINIHVDGSDIRHIELSKN